MDKDTLNTVFSQELSDDQLEAVSGGISTSPAIPRMQDTMSQQNEQLHANPFEEAKKIKRSPPIPLTTS